MVSSRKKEVISEEWLVVSIRAARVRGSARSKRAEVRRQKVEVRSEKLEDRRWKTGVRSQESGVRRANRRITIFRKGFGVPR